MQTGFDCLFAISFGRHTEFLFGIKCSTFIANICKSTAFGTRLSTTNTQTMNYHYFIYVFHYSDEDHDVVTNYFRKNTKRIGLLSFLKTAQDTILPQRVKKGY